MEPKTYYIQLICFWGAVLALISASVWGIKSFRKTKPKEPPVHSYPEDVEEELLKWDDIDFNNEVNNN